MNRQADSPSRRGQLIAGLAFTSLLLIFVFWMQPSGYQEQLDALRADGYPTNLNERHAYFPVPPGQNETTQLWAAAVSAIDGAGVPKKGTALPFVGTLATPPAERGVPWQDLEASRDFLKSLSSEFQTLQVAIDAGGVANYPPDFSRSDTPSSKFEETRTLARILTLSAYVHRHDGDDSAVLDDIKGIFAVSDSLGSNPSFSNHLLRNAIHAMGCQLAADMLPEASWSDEELLRLQTQIGGADFRNDLLVAMHGELPVSLSEIATARGIQFRESNSMQIILAYRRTFDGLSLPWDQALASQDALGKEHAALSRGLIGSWKHQFAGHIIPMLKSMVMASAVAESRQRCAVALIAATRFQKKHDRWPTAVEDLEMFVPENGTVGAALLTDPFGGSQLKMKAGNENGTHRIYSIGVNSSDDGGKLDSRDVSNGDIGYLLRAE